MGWSWHGGGLGSPAGPGAVTQGRGLGAQLIVQLVPGKHCGVTAVYRPEATDLGQQGEKVLSFQRERKWE